MQAFYIDNVYYRTYPRKIE